MTRKVTAVSTVVLAALLSGMAHPAVADEQPGKPVSDSLYTFASLGTQPDTLVATSGSLLPKRWCIESHMATPSTAMQPRSDTDTADYRWPLDTHVSALDLEDRFADRSDLSYQLSELDSDRLITFWRGDSLGIFLGITRGGFVSLSIAQ